MQNIFKSSEQERRFPLLRFPDVSTIDARKAKVDAGSDEEGEQKSDFTSMFKNIVHGLRKEKDGTGR